MMVAVGCSINTVMSFTQRQLFFTNPDHCYCSMDNSDIEYTQIYEFLYVKQGCIIETLTRSEACPHLPL